MCLHTSQSEFNRWESEGKWLQEQNKLYQRGIEKEERDEGYFGYFLGLDPHVTTVKW